MYRRCLLPIFALILVFALGACTNKNVQNPLADVGSAQPDKVLFDRAMDAMKRNKFDVARMTLQTLINTYPDSEYLARAKLAVGDSWYAAGGTAAFAQAEAEYKDFITFFPNMAEASEAQLKIANLHYRQMYKPDRDSTHALRAEQEYRTLLLQYPDSPLIGDAKQRLMEVQEVLAEREFRIGRFYYMRQSWAAATARLKSVIDTYPLYSEADGTLYMLGQAYEAQVEMVRAARMHEVVKGDLIKTYSEEAAKAYARILTRYPAMERADAARERLAAMNYTVPEPTPEALEQNLQEEASRREPGMFGKVWDNFSRAPDTSAAARVGEPTLIDPQQTSAPELVRQANELVRSAVARANAGNNTVSVETVNSGEPAPNQPMPSAQSVPNVPVDEPNNSGIAELTPIPDAKPAPSGPEATGIPELLPMTDQEAAQAGGGQGPQTEPPAPAPPQVNEANLEAEEAVQKNATEAKADSDDSRPDAQESSSSRPKKKRGFLGVF